MSIYDNFAEKVVAFDEDKERESELKTVSIRLLPKEVKTADFLAGVFSESRQSILSEVIEQGLHDALFGYFKGAGLTGEEATKIQAGLSGFGSFKPDEDQEELSL